ADNTLVIIASDHGYEFDELGLGYLGHASNFSRWQLVSTLMMRWPGRDAAAFTHRSAHRDLPVTLLQEVFGCSNPPEDYASGKSLFDTDDWEWIVAGSYNSHAIVQPKKVVVTYPGGFIEVLGEDYLPAKDLGVDGELTQEVMLEMRRFYQ
ncbi:MAG: hydrolase, partial [Gammaproteobacteria bacterium]|nr:hydrolase [Gammaproteobacteria bacterium]